MQHRWKITGASNKAATQAFDSDARRDVCLTKIDVKVREDSQKIYVFRWLPCRRKCLASSARTVKSDERNVWMATAMSGVGLDSVDLARRQIRLPRCFGVRRLVLGSGVQSIQGGATRSVQGFFLFKQRLALATS